MISSGLLLSLLFLAPALLAQDPGCGTDEKGVARSPGDAWKEECNNCRCSGAGVKACTKRFCFGDLNFTEAEDSHTSSNNTHIDVVILDTEKKTMATPNDTVNFEAPSMFTVEKADVSGTPQCKQAGVQECQKVSFNPESLASLKPGDKVQLTPGGIELTYRSILSPSSGSKSYDFTTPGGLEALFTVGGGLAGGKATSVTGSVHHNGRIYVVESCGDGCLVMYYRDQSFFENLQD